LNNINAQKPFGLLRVLKFTDTLIQYEKGVEVMENIAESIRRATPLVKKEEKSFIAKNASYAHGNVEDKSCVDTLILLQHFPVFTLGKRGHASDFKASESEIQARLGATISSVGRGGEVTYHGPGQLVAYPVISLRRRSLGPRAFVESLEDTVSQTVRRWGIQAEGRVPGRTGVWVDDQRKIAAIGVQIRHGVTTHGLALNVNTDLSAFDLIVPCGISDKEVTSMAKELSLRDGTTGRGMEGRGMEGRGMEGRRMEGRRMEGQGIDERGTSLKDIKENERKEGANLNEVTLALVKEFQAILGYEEVEFANTEEHATWLNR